MVFDSSGDRARRLLRALPKVSEAIRVQRTFREDAAKIWTDLRRGLNDLKKDVTLLESLAAPGAAAGERCVADVWEFVLALMACSPKFARQIMDAVDVLLQSPRWAAGFVSSKGRGRLALWKFSGGDSGVGANPVSLTIELLKLGTPADELLPAAEVVENAPSFVEELFSRSIELEDDQQIRLENSHLATAWHAARIPHETSSGSPESGAAGLPVARDSSGGLLPISSREGLGTLSDANEAQAASIEAAGQQDRRPGCQKDVVDCLLDVASEAFECAAKCLEPMLSGYAGEQNIALSARAKVLEFRQRQANLQAQLVVLGACEAGKTSLTHSLVGFAALPPAAPSMVTTRWVHTPSLAVPRLTTPEPLAELLQSWLDRLPGEDGGHVPGAAAQAPPHPLGQDVEGMDAVAAALERIHWMVHRGRQLGVIKAQELEKLARPAMSIQVEVAFAALANLEERLADTGTLSLVDLPSPDFDFLWEQQDISNLCRRALQEADGVLLVVDASRQASPRWLGELLRDAFLQERILRREDAWVVANRIDQLPEFGCEGGVTDACEKAKRRQEDIFKGVILGEDHVIPTAAKLSLLALYGLRRVESQLSPKVVAELSVQPWFAQVCSILFGVHWSSHVRNMERSKWRQSMRELQLLGQVTGPLANSVLKTAYVKMLPRSVARVMFDLSQLIEHFIASLRALEGGAAMIDVQLWTKITQFYLEDAQKRVSDHFEECVPNKRDQKALAAEKCGAPVVFQDPESAELNEKYFAILAREALAAWQPLFGLTVARCCEEARKAHQKWQRSIDHYLTKGEVDAATRQKVLLDSKNLRLLSDTEGVSSLLDAAQRDRLVLEHASQVQVTKSKQLFHQTLKSYCITPEVVCRFIFALCGAWTQACRAEIERRCIQPLHRNVEEMMQNIEELNSHRFAGVRQPKAQRESFDFSFARKLEEILPQVASFNAQQGELSDAVEAAEAERCEKFCEEVRAVLREINPHAETGQNP